MKENINNKSKKGLLWTARIIGTIIVAYWLLMGIGYGLSESEPFTWESAVITILIIASTMSMVAAWRREKLGGIMLVIVGVAFCIFAVISAGHNHLFAVLISGVPFIIIGSLFLISNNLKNTPKHYEDKKDSAN